MTCHKPRMGGDVIRRVLAAVTITGMTVTAGSAQSVSGAGLTASHFLGPVTIGHAVPLPGGGVAVALIDDLQIVLWRPGSADQVRRLGRNGEGPGEFRHIRMIGLVEANLWAVDSRLQRITLFPLGGGKPRIMAIPRAFTRGGEAATSTLPIAILPGDSLVAQVNFSNWARAMPGRPQSDPPAYAVALLAPDGAIVRILFAVPRDDCMAAVPNNPGMRIPKPFCPVPHMDSAPEGRFVGVVEPLSTAGESGRVRVSVIRSDGIELLRTELSFSLVAVSRYVEDSIRARLTTSARNFPPQLIEAIQQIPFPSHMPPTLGFMVTDGGTAWLRLGDDGHGQRWVQVSSGRGVTTTVTLPRNAEAIAATVAGLWLQTMDAEGEVSIAFFRTTQSR